MLVWFLLVHSDDKLAPLLISGRERPRRCGIAPVVSKLIRDSPKDMEDVKALAKKLHLSFDVLRKRFASEMSWVSNQSRHEQTLDVVWKEYFQL